MKQMAAFLTVFLLMIFCSAAIADGKKGTYQLKKLDRKMQTVILMEIRKLGIDSNNVQVNVSTGDCPSNCNSEVIGGKCYCGLDEKGKCPKGTEKSGDSNPTPGRECSTLPDTANIVGGGGMPPAQVQMP